MRGYNIYSIFNLCMSMIYTKIFHHDAKLIRLPVVIRGSNNINFGKGFVSGRYCRLDALSEKKEQIKFGNNCQINDSVHIAAINNIHIGNNVLIAGKVFITDHQHGNYSGENQSLPQEVASDRLLSSGPVIIADNTWIGEGVVILPGVTIGENSIVGANSVVTKNIPMNAIACGNPAKVIKTFDPIEKCWVPVGK
ncbi:acetyltransferase [Colwellia sp. MB02u-6]|uniref:DapH/DapD/GlmU-related protein n=1 Tax=Colwellia sp. MB02u-6 TaxID=2759824 RepID=UPI0015F5BBAF|nr:DapH/DapD/GlmU-related protein [Colwellia sp. MB02u-6]MBA6326356.1 acetyltransferase [Colwellia sp. MB02u-6]